MSDLLLFQIGFLNVEWVDALDIGLVAFLLYQVYNLVKGSLASRILSGYLFIYIFYLIVKALGLELLTKILEYFMGVGAIALIIIFQQEIRRFLMYIGTSTVFTNNRLLGRFFRPVVARQNTNILKPIIEAARTLAGEFKGGILVMKKSDDLEKYIQTGDEIDGVISKKLLVSIFNEYSPLHDGAVIIADGRIKSARCILPVSDSNDKLNVGFRHRAALGMSEATDAALIVVSEETGRLSLALEGELHQNLPVSEIEERLKKYLFE